MHPFVHRKDVPIHNYSRCPIHLQGGKDAFLRFSPNFLPLFCPSEDGFHLDRELLWIVNSVDFLKVCTICQRTALGRGNTEGFYRGNAFFYDILAHLTSIRKLGQG